MTPRPPAAGKPRPPAAGKPARPQVLFLTGAGLMAAVALRSIAELSKSFDVIAGPAADALGSGRDAPCAEATVHVDDLPVEESLWAAVPYLYTATTRRERAPRIGEDIAQRLSGPLDAGAIRRQQSIAQAHDSSGHLGQIAAPTLVIHGEQDRLVPLENGRRLADAIPGAELLTLPDGGHAFPTDVPGSGQELVTFLRAHSRAQRRSAGRSSRAAHA